MNEFNLQKCLVCSIVLIGGTHGFSIEHGVYKKLCYKCGEELSEGLVENFVRDITKFHSWCEELQKLMAQKPDSFRKGAPFNKMDYREQYDEKMSPAQAIDEMVNA